MTEGEHKEHSQTISRIGAVCVIVGSLAVLGFGAAHGDLPEGTGRDVLGFVAAHPNYGGVHLGASLGGLILAIGLTTLPNLLTRSVAWSFGRLGAASVLVGTAIFIFHFTSEGFALDALSDSWTAAQPSEQASIERTTELSDVILLGPAFSWIIILWGLSPILFGLAVALDSRRTAWLGWVGVAVGAATLIGGVTLFLRLDLIPDWIIFAVATLGTNLWMLMLGVMMWRRARPAEVV